MKRISVTILILLMVLSSLFSRINDTPSDGNVFNFSLIPFYGGTGVNIGSLYYAQHDPTGDNVNLEWAKWAGKDSGAYTENGVDYVAASIFLPTAGSGNSSYSPYYSDYHMVALGGGYHIPYNDTGNINQYTENGNGNVRIDNDSFFDRLDIPDGATGITIRKDDISLDVNVSCDSDFEFVSQSNPIYRRPFEIEIIPRVAINGVGDGITTTEKIYKMNSTNNQVTIKIPSSPPNARQGQNNVAMLAADMTLVLPYDYANYASDGGYFSGGLTYNNATYSLADASDYTAVVTITLTLNINYSYTYNNQNISNTYTDTRVLTIPFSGFYSSAGSQDVRDDSISLHVSANSNAANLNLARQGEWITVGSIEFLYNDRDGVPTSDFNNFSTNADIVRIFLSNSAYPSVQADSRFRMIHENATSVITDNNSLAFDARIVGTGADSSDISVENPNSNEVIFDGLAWEGNISTAEKNDTYDAVKTVCNFGTISNNMLNADRVQVYRHFHTFEGVIDIRFAKSNMLAAGRYKGYIYVHAVTEENI